MCLRTFSKFLGLYSSGLYSSVEKTESEELRRTVYTLGIDPISYGYELRSTIRRWFDTQWRYCSVHLNS